MPPYNLACRWVSSSSLGRRLFDEKICLPESRELSLPETIRYYCIVVSKYTLLDQRKKWKEFRHGYLHASNLCHMGTLNRIVNQMESSVLVTIEICSEFVLLDL